MELFFDFRMTEELIAALTSLGIRFLIDLIMIVILVNFIYYRYKKDNEYAFTFTLFNIIIFFVCFLMIKANISMGFAFGLFAIFGILRYRTITIPIKEMTYLFTAITIALINAIGPFNVMIIIINLAIIFAIIFLENFWFKEKELFTNIQFEKIDLIQRGDETLVIEDIKKRTGLDVTRIVIKSFNFLNDSADIKVYYKV